MIASSASDDLRPPRAARVVAELEVNALVGGPNANTKLGRPALVLGAACRSSGAVAPPWLAPVRSAPSFSLACSS